MCGWGDGTEGKANVQIQELELRSQHPPVLPELKKQRRGFLGQTLARLGESVSYRFSGKPCSVK